METRDLYLYGEINNSNAESVIEKLIQFSKEDQDKLDKDIKPIVLHIHSDGGRVDSAYAIIDTMKNIKTPVITLLEGGAYSAGSFIAMSGDYRLIQKSARHMIHSVGSGAIGTSQEMKEATEEVMRTQERFIKHVMEHSYITEEKLREVLEKKLDWYIYADEAIRLGLADKIVESEKNKKRVDFVKKHFQM